eukprot:142340-Rhodomonas_salina.1
MRPSKSPTLKTVISVTGIHSSGSACDAAMRHVTPGNSASVTQNVNITCARACEQAAGTCGPRAAARHASAPAGAHPDAAAPHPPPHREAAGARVGLSEVGQLWRWCCVVVAVGSSSNQRFRLDLVRRIVPATRPSLCAHALDCEEAAERQAHDQERGGEVQRGAEAQGLEGIAFRKPDLGENPVVFHDQHAQLCGHQNRSERGKPTGKCT